MDSYSLRNLKKESTLSSSLSPSGQKLFENLITVEEVACAFGVAPRTIRNWVSLRQIPYTRVRGKTFFRLKSLEMWIQRKEVSCL